jgi:4-diphosphocytidyl-2-C-methyl-D-erythritol kinase
MPKKTVLRAPAKLNLCLYVGPTREDGLHQIASIFEPLDLADELSVSEAEGSADEVICAEVGGPNLVERALDAMRAAGWRSPPLRVEITKRIPVAAGLGGGSADAAAVLRLARGELEGIRAVAASVGADVPSQLQPRPCVVAGAGEVVEPIPPPGEHAVVLVPQTMGLTTADVYAEADRLAQIRGESELESIRRKLRDAVDEGASPLDYPEHLVNDLQAASISLRPEIEQVLAALTEAGAAHAMVTGSGPTAFGLFGTRAAADGAVAALATGFPTALATAPLDPGTGTGPEPEEEGA